MEADLDSDAHVRCMLGSGKPQKLPLISQLWLIAVLLAWTCASGANAQPVNWTQQDIGNTGATGTYSFSAGTYTIAGAGSGIGGTSDSFSYVSVPTTGNVEIIARVATQTNTNNYALSGLMIRSSLNAAAAQAVVGVSPAIGPSPGQGVTFTSRAADGAASNTTLGPSVAAPVWLRLARSGSSLAAHQSPDGINWTLVGTTQFSLPKVFYIGFAVCSNSFGNLSTANFDHAVLMSSVPQRSANMLMWLRSDVGVLSSAGQVSQWTDQSDNGNSASQNATGSRPSLVTDAINGLPALNFNGTSHYFQLASDFTDFSSGASILVVTKPTAVAGGRRFIDVGSGANNNNIRFDESGSAGARLFVFVGTTGNNVTSANAITANQYQLLEVVHNGAGTATIYTNGVQGAQGPINNIPTVTRIGHIGRDLSAGGANFFAGEIAEILVYRAPLTTAQRQDLESYIFSKYAIGTAPTLAAPTITPGVGVFSGSTSITLAANANAAIYYTTDGSTPTTSSLLYTGPFTISNSATVKAIAWATPPFYQTSLVSSAFIQIDPLTTNVSRTGLKLWLKADNGAITSGTSVSQWTDVSGSTNNATQGNASNRPALVAGAINNLPALDFNGTSHYLQFGSGFANFLQGASIFIVTKPTTTSGGPRFIDLGVAQTQDNLLFRENSATGVRLSVYSGTSASAVVADNTISVGQYQLFEAVHNGAGQGTIYKNGVQVAQNAVNNLLNVARTGFISRDFAGGAFFTGQIAEILLYDRGLSAAERVGVEGYINSRYQLSVHAPTINPAAGIFADNPTVTISGDPGASIFYTTDGSTPTTGSTPYAGPFIVSSSSTVKAIAQGPMPAQLLSPVSTAHIEIDQLTGNVSRTGLKLWLRADTGVITSGSNVSQWSDASGSGNNATQVNAPSQPLLIGSSVNGRPGLSFNGTSQFLQWLPGFADFTAGASIFVVTKPTTTSGGPRFIEFGDGATLDNLIFRENSASGVRLSIYNGTSASALDANAAITANQYQVLEAIHNGAGSATIYTNGNLISQGTLNNLLNVTRDFNFISRDFNGGNFFTGEIAEILVYNRPLTASERSAVETYIYGRYEFKISAPTISPGLGVFSSTTPVTISADPGSAIYYTTDGTTPIPGTSPLYTGPLSITTSTTIKAIARGQLPTQAVSAVSSAYIQIDPVTANVSRDGLTLWLKADNGVSTSGANVTQWLDVSGSGNNATQSTPANQPTLASNAVNSLPALNFTAVSEQWLQFGSGFANFTQGASIFVVTKPTSVTTNVRFFHLGTGQNANTLYLSEIAPTGANLSVTGSNVTSTSGISVGTYQLLEAVHNGAGSATVYRNGTQGAQGTIDNIPNVTRTGNYVGRDHNNSLFFNGQMAEILVYNRPLSQAERVAVEGYILSRYQFAVSPPVISPGLGVFSGTTTVTITADPGSSIFFTTDGSTPTTGSTPYTGAFNITTSTTVKAIARGPAPAQIISAVASSYLQVDSLTANVSRTGLTLWLKADNGVTTTGSNVTNWTDMSGNANNAAQSNASNQPTLVTAAINNLPALAFNGSTQYLQFGSGFADFTAGTSIFVVTKPTSVTTNVRFFHLGTGQNTNTLYLSESAPTGSNLSVTGSNLVSPGGITVGQYQVLEAVHNGVGSATMYTSGVQGAQGTIDNIPNVNRTSNFVGRDHNNNLFFNGQMAEILIYNRSLSATERRSVEGYLFKRYQVAVNPPTISPVTGVYTAPQTVVMTADPGASIYYTTDGSVPTTGSTLYTGPFIFSGASTFRAIAVQPFGTSAVSMSSVAVDSTTGAISRSGLLFWLRSDAGVITGTGAPPLVSQWTDVSGNAYNAAQPSPTLQPTFITNSISSLPGVKFDGSDDYLQFGSADLRQGTSIFLVSKPAVLPSGHTEFLMYFANSNINYIELRMYGEPNLPNGRFSFTVRNAPTIQSVQAFNSIVYNSPQLYEIVQGSGTATIYKNGVFAAQGSASNLAVITPSNFLGGGGIVNAWFSGHVGEVLMYNRAVSGSERAAIEGYLIGRYNLFAGPATAPVISVPTSTLSGPTQVSIAAQPGATVHYTVDGTDPTTSSPVYAVPIKVYYSQTIKAIAAQSGLTSTVASATYTLDPSQWPAPSAGDTTPLNINLQLPTNAAP